MDDFSHTARVNVLKEVLDDLVLVCDDVGHNLLLLAVNEKLHNFAEVSSEDHVDWFFISAIFSLQEFEKAIKQHVLAELLAFI